jgi:hypothetical protein
MRLPFYRVIISALKAIFKGIKKDESKIKSKKSKPLKDNFKELHYGVSPKFREVIIQDIHDL